MEVVEMVARAIAAAAHPGTSEDLPVMVLEPQRIAVPGLQVIHVPASVRASPLWWFYREAAEVALKASGHE